VSVVGKKEEGVGVTHDAIEDGFPTLAFVLLHSLEEQFPVLWNQHLLINEELVTRLVVRLEGEAFGEGRIHRVDIDVYYSVSIVKVDPSRFEGERTYTPPRASRAM
jgi:hypothetical protein